jgi:hypothetical protein
MASCDLAFAKHQTRGAQVGEDSKAVPIRQLAAFGSLDAIKQQHRDLGVSRRNMCPGFIDQNVDFICCRI